MASRGGCRSTFRPRCCRHGGHFVTMRDRTSVRVWPDPTTGHDEENPSCDPWELSVFMLKQARFQFGKKQKESWRKRARGFEASTCAPFVQVCFGSFHAKNPNSCSVRSSYLTWTRDESTTIVFLRKKEETRWYTIERRANKSFFLLVLWNFKTTLFF